MALLCCCLPFRRAQMPDLELSLVSASNTFLNGTLVDSATRRPVYAVATLESRTAITAHRGRDARTRAARSHTGAAPAQALVASVQWPARSPHIVPLRPGAPRARAAPTPRRDEDSARVHLDDGSVLLLPRFLKRRSQALCVSRSLSSFRRSPFPSVSVWADHFAFYTRYHDGCPIPISISMSISSAGTFHKFRIPGYPATFKWKQSGRKYQVSLRFRDRSPLPSQNGLRHRPSFFSFYVNRTSGIVLTHSHSRI